ncbi:MAG: GspH/FimT family pseudopilin [Gemmatimonadota bacterium]
MRKGFVLIELLIAIAAIGILLLAVLPVLNAARDRLAVEEAARQIASAHNRARMMAVTESRPALLLIRPDSLILSVIDGVDTLPRWSAAGAGGIGVTLSGPVRPLVFSPLGITLGLSNATFLLGRGVASRQVIISRYGRVRVQ